MEKTMTLEASTTREGKEEKNMSDGSGGKIPKEKGHIKSLRSGKSKGWKKSARHKSGVQEVRKDVTPSKGRIWDFEWKWKKHASIRNWGDWRSREKCQGRSSA